jgi:glycosyltransferase involved in cell wall biosynthesis
VAELSAYAEQRGVAEHITFTGFRDDLRELLAAWNLMVLPSLWEGFGLVLLEAALCGRPVLAARQEGITDAIHDGKNGTLVEAGNAGAWVAAIQKVIAAPPALQPREYTLQNFSWSARMEEYTSLIKNTLKKK